MEKILACLSPSPSNPRILRAAADMAGTDCELIALFVETPQFPQFTNADRKRLRENIQIAVQLGASIQTVSGDDVPFQIAEYAKQSGIRKSFWDRAASGFLYFLIRPVCRTDWRTICPMRRSM